MTADQPISLRKIPCRQKQTSILLCWACARFSPLPESLSHLHYEPQEKINDIHIFTCHFCDWVEVRVKSPQEQLTVQKERANGRPEQTENRPGAPTADGENTTGTCPAIRSRHVREDPARPYSRIARNSIRVPQNAFEFPAQISVQM